MVNMMFLVNFGETWLAVTTLFQSGQGKINRCLIKPIVDQHQLSRDFKLISAKFPVKDDEKNYFTYPKRRTSVQSTILSFIAVHK